MIFGNINQLEDANRVHMSQLDESSSQELKSSIFLPHELEKAN